MTETELRKAEAEVQRLKRDPHRLIWKDEAATVCQSHGLCFEHGDTVRCGPCGAKLAAAAGVEVVPGLPNLPEVFRLNRELTALRAKVKSQAEALKPFARQAEAYGPEPSDDTPLDCADFINVGDLRRAAQEAGHE